MAGQPSIASDYISIISQAIEKAQNDPAHLRSLVYDTARSCNGTFHYVRVSDKAAWDELVGEYKIPTVVGSANKN
jgi:hypothetical protein